MENDFKIIAAVSSNGVIGVNNDLPWKIPEDMKHFKRTTTGHIVIMGRKTFESFGAKPLPNRMNVIISGSSVLASKYTILSENAVIVKDIESLEFLSEIKDKQKFVIGGGQIYKEFLDRGLVEQCILTEVKKEYEGDVYFPHWDTLFSDFPYIEMLESNEQYMIAKHTRR